MNRPRSPAQRGTLATLRRSARTTNATFWADVATRLDVPRARRAEVNLAKLARLTKRGDVVLVPGKVLGTGLLTHSVTVGADAFSAAAVRKIRQAKGTALGLSDFAKVYQSKGVKIIGG